MRKAAPPVLSSLSQPALPLKRPRAVPSVKAPAKAAPRAKSAPEPRPTPTVALAGGHVWKMSGRHGVAYVRDAALAGELLATEPKHLARAAMAVYYDKKGRAFAWQVRFDVERWDDVLRRLA